MTGRLRQRRPARTPWVALGMGVLLAGCAGSTPGTGGADGVAAGSATSGRVAVECGLSVLDEGQQVVRYCGDGEARITAVGGPYDVKGAECRQRGEFLTANFGTNFSKDETAQGEYVGLLLGGVATGGGSAGQVKISGLEVTVAGKRMPLTEATATASLKDGRLQGNLRGQVEGGPVTIEFHCATA